MRWNILLILAGVLMAAAPPTPAPEPHLGAWSPAVRAFCFPSGLRVLIHGMTVVVPAGERVVGAANECRGHEVLTVLGPEAPIRASLAAAGFPAQ